MGPLITTCFTTSKPNTPKKRNASSTSVTQIVRWSKVAGMGCLR